MAQNGHKAPLLDIQVHPPEGMAHLVLICLFIVSDIVKYQIYCSYDSHSWPFFPGRSRPERRKAACLIRFPDCLLVPKV